MMKNLKQNQDGAVLFFTVLVIGIAIFFAFLILSQSGIESFSGAYTQGESMDTRAKVFGCLDELLIQLQVDPNYSTTSLDVIDATCDVTITTPQVGQRSLEVGLTEGAFTRSVTAVITVDPVSVVSITE